MSSDKEVKRVSIGDVLSKALGVQDVKSAKIVSDAFTDNSQLPLDDAKNLAYRADIRRGEVGLYTRLMALADFAELEEVLYGFKEEGGGLDFTQGILIWRRDVEDVLSGRIPNATVFVDEPLPPRDEVAPVPKVTSSRR